MPFEKHAPQYKQTSEVREKMLKGTDQGISVEEAKRRMQEAGETPRGAATRGVGGNTPAEGLSPFHTGIAKLRRLRLADGTKVDLDKLLELGVITEDEHNALSNSTLKAAKTEVAETANEPEVVEELVPAASIVEEPVAVLPERAPVVPAVTEEDDKREKIETKKFVGEIYRDGNEWVAELTYKNGAGSERFSARTIRDLNKKLLEGKGHATVKVRETVQRYKLGDIYDTWDIFFQEVHASHGLTVEQYNALPEQSRKFVQDTIEASYIIAFKENYPEYYATQSNFQKIGQYLNSRKIPLTLHNLELAYRDLTEDDILDVRPKSNEVVTVAEPQVPVAAPVSAPVPTARVEDSAPVAPTAPAAAAPVVTVRKRGSTGLIPGQSSVAPVAPAAKTEDGNGQRELSNEELRTMDLKELRRKAIPSLSGCPRS